MRVCVRSGRGTFLSSTRRWHPTSSRCRPRPTRRFISASRFARWSKYATATTVCATSAQRHHICSHRSVTVLFLFLRFVSQLLAVLPAASAKGAGLPASLQALMVAPTSPILSYYPVRHHIHLYIYIYIVIYIIYIFYVAYIPWCSYYPVRRHVVRICICIYIRRLSNVHLCTYAVHTCCFPASFLCCSSKATICA
eukprot:COSAG06_NODE_1365_length_9687_cov_14.601064_7_plen_196_part_00